jgi:hypothetical protein
MEYFLGERLIDLQPVCFDRACPSRDFIDDELREIFW